ncbi:MAG: hypothetical protein KAS17_08445 [Victivallaceae bacterium]|nr:hypothetical protein [Victivallaceae bacterium]
MKFLKSGLMLLSVLMLISGCATTEKEKAKIARAKAIKTRNAEIKQIKDNLTRFSEKEEAEAKKFAISKAGNFYKSVKDKDYDSFCKSRKMSKKKFNQWHKAVTKRYGKLESQEYIGSISNPLIIRYIWKWNFSRKTKGKTLSREVLHSTYIAKDKQKNEYILLEVSWE